MTSNLRMNQVLPSLWIGDLMSAVDHQTLKQNGIHSVLSAMRGKVSIHETFHHHHIELDDHPDADALENFVPAITFIQGQVDKGRGVLVHCFAGMSRSATLVVAYLMFTQRIGVDAALEKLREVRPIVEPNEGFMKQLKLFEEAEFRVSPDDKGTRIFYTNRGADQLTYYGDQGGVKAEMFAASPSGLNDSRRLIRCRLCRQGLATKENMFEHGKPAAGSTPHVDARHLAEPPIPTPSTIHSNPSRPPFIPPRANKASLGPVDQAAQVYSNPNLAALRIAPVTATVASPSPGSLPVHRVSILSNSECSGYFLEPMQWMEPVIHNGELAGKLFCPNKSCGVKIGNYDWAGVCCGCHEWVTPGFCVSRSKVDEVG